MIIRHCRYDCMTHYIRAHPRYSLGVLPELATTFLKRTHTYLGDLFMDRSDLGRWERTSYYGRSRVTSNFRLSTCKPHDATSRAHEPQSPSPPQFFSHPQPPPWCHNAMTS